MESDGPVGCRWIRWNTAPNRSDLSLAETAAHQVDKTGPKLSGLR
jgi:hypothetical protein